MNENNYIKTDPSATAAFNFVDVSQLNNNKNIKDGFKCVVIGGGTGAPLSLKTALSLGVDVSCVVAMADDGGSTGNLRECVGVSAPGDIRKCLVALSNKPNSPLTQAFKYRFKNANDHTLGNLILSALEVSSRSFVESIEICEKLLECKGHVYPSTLDDITLNSQNIDGEVLYGQRQSSLSSSALDRVWLEKKDGSEPAGFDRACEAIENCDVILLGPGSLFTSIIANILIPSILQSILNSKAKVVFVCGIGDTQGETLHMSAKEHVLALEKFGLAGRIDACLFNDTTMSQRDDLVKISQSDISELEKRNIKCYCKKLTSEDAPYWHCAEKYRCALSDIFIDISNSNATFD